MCVRLSFVGVIAVIRKECAFFLLLLLVLLSQNLINSCQPIVVVAVASFGANEKGAKLRGHVFRIFDNSINYVSMHIINGTSKRKLLNWISHSFK